MRQRGGQEDAGAAGSEACKGGAAKTWDARAAAHNIETEDDGLLSLLGGLLGMLGQVVGFAGLALSAWSFIVLVVFPPASPIVRKGPFGFARHPMYGGFLIRAIGMCMAYPISWRPVGALILLLIVELKTRSEESWFAENLGDEWKAYCEAVPNRFLPR
mmetsp:Transcript_159671/g.281898  ORF Transcript_159671/g.281898 Transcript_159671/m.281898 type:complete len:159 (+) Transcript_159671:107-583(+)